MTERPILFSAPMVRALLAGTKTQTRRVATPKRSIEPMTDECPYGQPGDRLWVRESFSGARAYETRGYPLREWGNKIFYWADGQPRSGDWTRPRPSIHMPRCLSRITLEVTEVRVERLQDISPTDAQAEGIPHHHDLVDCRRERYRELWEQINGHGSWDANPWVWVVAFKRVAP